MIRHRPFGSGDPYHVDPDQRNPTIPEVDAACALGALCSPDIRSLVVEWRDSAGTRIVSARRLGTVKSDGTWSGPRTSTGEREGHLAAAAHRTRRRGVVWTAEAPPMAFGDEASYRFVSTRGPKAATAWHRVRPARWKPGGVGITLDGAHEARRRFLPETVETFSDGDQVLRARFALKLADGDHVIGFGERFDRLDQRGHRLDTVVYEQYKDQGATGRTYLPMPFAHIINAAGSGCGIHVDTGHRCWFDIGETVPDQMSVEVDLTGEKAPHVLLHAYRGSPREVLEAFTRATGRPAAPPGWVYRLWISGNEWNTQELVMQQVNRHLQLDIPFGALVIEAWSDESTFCFFRGAQYEVHDDGRPHQAADIYYPSDGAWPDPKAMIDELHSRGVKVLLWQVPLQKMRPPPHGQAAADAQRMISSGYCVRQANGRPYRNRGWWFPQALMPDFTKPEARAWWQDKRRYLVSELGVDGFKTDGGEHAWGRDLRYHDGSQGAASNNRYPVEYARAYHELMASSNRVPVTFSRSGYVGSQAFPCHWAGDENSTWQAFRNSIIAGLSAGSCGIVHWGWDIAGFSGEIPTAELYLRATQASCFMPIMQYHSEFNFHRSPSRDRTPWNIAKRRQCPEVVTIFRQFAKIREALLPYLIEQGALSTKTGFPLMRALPLVHPDDEHSWQHPTQFYLGNAILVAPVTEPAKRTWPVYLPAGEWRSLLDGRRFGGGHIEAAAPITWTPVFVRERDWVGLRGLATQVLSAELSGGRVSRSSDAAV